MRKPRVRYTGITAVIAGCRVCSPDGSATWESKNAQAVAARHHDATGHTTWVNSILSIQYGEDVTEDGETR